jgi:O-antigen ligase/tetratricopeptide (TPR) repeat protein
MWPALALPLASFVLSTAASPFPRLGLDYVAWAVLLTALYLLLVRILALPYARARIGGLAAVLALVLGGAYVLLAFVLWAEWWGLVGEIRVPPLRPMYLSMPWGGPSAVLTVQVLLTAVAMAGLGITTRSARVTVALLAVLAGAVAVISGSRSGWLALAGALVLVAGLWLLSSSSRASLTRALRRGRVRVALVVVGAVVLVAIVLVGPAALDRFVEGGDGGRPVYWATALRMFAEAPVLGLGPGNWAARRIAYTEAGELDFYIPHAHNQLLETGAEFGLLGLAAGTVAVGCVAWLVVTALRGADQARRRWAWAATFVLVYLAAATLVDSYTFPAILLPVAIAIAYLDATSHRALGLPHGLRSVARPLGRLAALGLLASSIAAVAFLARSESVALTHARGVAAANLSNWDDALAPSLEAAEADPGLAPYQVTAGLAAAGVADWATAEAAFHAAATTDDLPASWLGLALAQSELGRPVGEISDSLGRAMRLGEQQPAIAFAAAELYDRLGMVADADDAYAKALAGLPSLGADVTWRASLEPAGRFEGILERAIEVAPGSAWEIALMAGDSERAKVLVSDATTSVGSTPFEETLVAAWSGDEAAIATVRAAADADPMDAHALAWAARLSDRAGDLAAAERYRRLVDIGHRGTAQGVEARVGERRPLRDAALGSRTFYYGNYLYRRTTPVDLLVPGMPGLVIAGDAQG